MITLATDERNLTSYPEYSVSHPFDDLHRDLARDQVGWEVTGTDVADDFEREGVSYVLVKTRGRS